MTRSIALSSAALALLLGFPFTVAAQAQDPQIADRTAAAEQGAGGAQGQSPPVLELATWNYDDIYANGWSVERLFEDAEVVGADGEEIGGVENLIIGKDGKILSLIAEVGGFLDIGDTHISVPWDRVKVSPYLDEVTIPVDEDSIDEYSVFGEYGYMTRAETGTTQAVNDDLTTGPRVWKATELLDDYTYLSDRSGYGYVRDLIFTAEGELHAVIVNAEPGYRGGRYAYPFYGFGYGYLPGAPYYDLPYDRDDVAGMERFDYGRMESWRDETAAGDAEASTSAETEPETSVN